MKYSIIIAIYNRPDEMKELLDSLAVQTKQDFEVVVVEDGSDDKCDHLIENYELDIQYFYKPNTGPGDSRNFGLKKGKGEYFLFFDSDCTLPPHYFETLDKALAAHALDVFGGADMAHHSFSDFQKAINYAMTSFFTTGGIRGGGEKMDKFYPRTFNMGFSRQVYESTNGFVDMHPGEDIDLSIRIANQGFKNMLIKDAYVFHKRRIDFKKFRLQMYKFGIARIILNQKHPQTKKLVYFLPAVFLIGNLTLAIAGMAYPIAWLPLPLYGLLLFLDSLRKGNGLKISMVVIPAAFIQLFAYGYGFLQAFIKMNIICKKAEKAFPKLFR